MLTRSTYLIFALLSFGLSSCAYFAVPRDIRQGFTICYDGEKTKIKELINIDGFFHTGKLKPSYNVIMFYDDGTFLYDLHDSNSSKREGKKHNIPLFLKEVINDSIGDIRTSFYKRSYWGIYKIEGDTIKTQFVNNSMFHNLSWSAWEKWYKVIDRKTIIEIYRMPLGRISESDLKIQELYRKRREGTILPSKFMAVEKKPEPNCWLKEQDWFWCDE